MIAIVVHGPDFASSENLTRVFKKWGDVNLICINPSDWRRYDEGLLYDEHTEDKIHSVLDQSDIIFLGDATSLLCLAKTCPALDWVNWCKSKTTIAYFGDSAYFKNPRFYDGLCEAMGVKRLFLLPNLMPLTSLSAVPLHHPMPVRWVDKDENLSVAHAPGRDGKALQKGTEIIEIIVAELQGNYEFDYKRLQYLTIKECLEIKNTAHIVIDQMPLNGVPYGMGRTGTEALAVGSAVMTRMYDTSVLRGFFEPPPTLDIQNEKQLQEKLGILLGNRDNLGKVQKESLAWAEEHVAFDKWLDYIGRYL